MSKSVASSSLGAESARVSRFFDDQILRVHAAPTATSATTATTATEPLPTVSPLTFDALVDEYFDFVWRSLRRLGVPSDSLDDATQQVWIVMSKRLSEIEPEKLRSFVFSVAMRVASETRRRLGRRRETDEAALELLIDERPSADELIDQREARAVLELILEAMPIDLRAVFILYELETLSAPEIAATLGVPTGTVASRLRRARETFEQIVRRFEARGEIKKGAR